MKIGIIGQGYVGTAVRTVFEKHYDVETYDIKEDCTCSSIKELVRQTDIIFVCVPTPMNKNGSCNTDIVEDVIKAIDIAVSRERTNLLGRNNTRMRLGIPDNSLDADIDDFNMRHPEYPITTESKDRSYAASTRMDITMDLFDGVSISTPRQLQVLMERMYDAGDSF